MPAHFALEVANFTELLLCVSILIVLTKRELLGEFRSLALFMGVRALSEMISIPILFFRKAIGLEKHFAYSVLFYSFWPIFLVQLALMIMIVYGVYSAALRPFPPLRNLGNIIFRWIAGVSMAVAVAVGLGPHMFGHGYAAGVVSQLQQSVCVLTLCLLVFVCFALRPLGLTFRSRLFGISLGLGIMSTVYLVLSAWLPTNAAQSVYSPIYVISGFGTCISMLIWGVYFYMPEPKWRPILLPTTSPYFFWNRISEALGDAPGFVAVSGMHPEMFAEAELEAFCEAHPQPKAGTPTVTIMRPVASAR